MTTSDFYVGLSDSTWPMPSYWLSRFPYATLGWDARTMLDDLKTAPARTVLRYGNASWQQWEEDIPLSPRHRISTSAPMVS